VVAQGRLVKCPVCGDWVPEEATFCVNCGAPGPKVHRRHGVLWGVLLVLIVLVALVIQLLIGLHSVPVSDGVLPAHARRRADEIKRGARTAARRLEQLGRNLKR